MATHILKKKYGYYDFEAMIQGTETHARIQMDTPMSSQAREFP
jgi:hypothetical protein